MSGCSAIASPMAAGLLAQLSVTTRSVPALREFNAGAPRKSLRTIGTRLSAKSITASNHRNRSDRNPRRQRRIRRQAMAALKMPRIAHDHCGNVVSAATWSHAPIKHTVVTIHRTIEKARNKKPKRKAVDVCVSSIQATISYTGWQGSQSSSQPRP